LEKTEIRKNRNSQTPGRDFTYIRNAYTFGSWRLPWSFWDLYL